MGGYRRPVSLSDALSLLAATPHRIIAGGTDVYPAEVARSTWAEPHPAHEDSRAILDVTAIDELRELEVGRQGVRIGAGVTWSELLAADLPPAFDGLKQAAREIGGRQIQNRGTLVGNIANASPAADGVPPLLTLDAEVEIRSRTTRRLMGLDQFVLGNRRTALRDDELITAVLVPLPAPSTRSRYLKLGARRYLVISIAAVALVVETDTRGTIRVARIAVGACSAVARRLSGLEADLVGASLADAADVVTAAHIDDLRPIDDVRASAVYRRDAALELLRRGLRAWAAPLGVAA